MEVLVNEYHYLMNAYMLHSNAKEYFRNIFMKAYKSKFGIN